MLNRKKTNKQQVGVQERPAESRKGNQKIKEETKMKKQKLSTEGEMMKVVTKEELVNILTKHRDFLNGVAGGVRADLHGADLIGFDLRGVDLSFANLSYAILRDSDLRATILRESNLRGADIHGVDIRGADLRGVDLSYADLSYADLSDSNLSHADLRGANLHGANLRGALLSGTTLDDKEQLRKGVILQQKMTGYKKLADGSICVLSIPKGAIVFSINGSKCRTNKAKVLEGGGTSKYDRDFVYEKGKKYVINDFDLAYNVECASGIHFFKTRKEAEDYIL